jgi:hypothetical protein
MEITLCCVISITDLNTPDTRKDDKDSMMQIRNGSKYPELHESSPYLHPYFFKIHSSHLCLGFLRVFFTHSFLNKIKKQK